MSASRIVLSILRACIGVLIFILVVLGLFRVGEAAYDLGYRVYTEQPVEATPGHDKVVEISTGMSALEIGTLLEEKGLVEDGLLFAIQMKLSAYSKGVQPGLYTLNTSQDARQMLQVMGATEDQDEDEEE